VEKPSGLEAGEVLDDVALGSLARAYRLDLTESEFAFHIDKLVPLRLIAIG
jgi:hypothetical protein